MVALARLPRTVSVLVSSKCADSGELSIVAVVEIAGWLLAEDTPVHALSSRVAATAVIAIDELVDRAMEGLEFNIMVVLLTVWTGC